MSATVPSRRKYCVARDTSAGRQRASVEEEQPGKGAVSRVNAEVVQAPTGKDAGGAVSNADAELRVEHLRKYDY